MKGIMFQNCKDSLVFKNIGLWKGFFISDFTGIRDFKSYACLVLLFS